MIVFTHQLSSRLGTFVTTYLSTVSQLAK